MNSKLSNSITVVLGFIVIIVIGYFVYKMTALIISKIDNLDANILVAILAAASTIIGFYITRYLERKKIIEQQIREQKLPIYGEFIDFMFKIFENTKANSKEHISTEEMNKFFWNLNKKSILWLSDNTLKSYVTWKNSISNINESNENKELAGTKLLLDFENLLLDFRKDIGHKNENIDQGDLLKMFVNDWDKHIEMMK